jgi:hypothetical protein
MTGISGLQDLLRWVDQPPPPQGRDTHVIHFILAERTPGPTSGTIHHGLMSFRPQGTGSGPVGALPGLTGFGGLASTGTSTPNTPFWARVEVFVRLRAPSNVFATLPFLVGDNVNGLPRTVKRTVELNTSFSGSLLILEAAPELWAVQFAKTNVLLRAPSAPEF